ncbi:TRM11 family methyltransferase [Paenibacillus sp. YN15]|uniref:TRM11 family SAM-dependent methyltransferase n=1 Tax=Paenibacillus sp. YN15 TaxID=1742774 RepID=UPI00215BCFD7|nr:RNA methyltransferase [Paenibacillus sp. YN15]
MSADRDMNMNGVADMDLPQYLYTFACREEELELCRMEQRALFGREACPGGWLASSRLLEPGRSPFIRQRLFVRKRASSLEELVACAEGWSMEGRTFKLRYVPTAENGFDYGACRQIERKVGAVIRGKAEMRQPETVLGVTDTDGGGWLLGELADNPAVWLAHQNKPQSYSTALSTRVARPLVNIALPWPDRELAGKTLLDPCCGMGTVLIEALSMGATASGSDVNPLAVQGARVNLAYFGYSDVVKLCDIAHAEGAYDAVIADLPYNLCSKSPRDEQLAILRHAAGLSGRIVLVTTEAEELDELVAAACLLVEDSCRIPKGKLVRRVLLCRLSHTPQPKIS